MLISKGEKLSTKELVKKIGISEGTWKNNKNDILMALSNACDFEAIYSRK